MIGKVEIEDVDALGWVGAHDALPMDVSGFQMSMAQVCRTKPTSASYEGSVAARSAYCGGPMNPTRRLDLAGNPLGHLCRLGCIEGRICCEQTSKS